MKRFAYLKNMMHAFKVIWKNTKNTKNFIKHELQVARLQPRVETQKYEFKTTNSNQEVRVQTQELLV